MSTAAEPNDERPRSLTMRPASLRANVRWLFAANCLFAASQWGSIIALAHLGSAEMVGQFTLALTIAGPVLLLANLSLRTVQATDGGRQFSFAEYRALRLLTTGLAMLAMLLICVICRFPSSTTSVVLLVGFAKASEALSDIHYGLMQSLEQLRPIAISMSLRGLLGFLSLVLLLYLTGSLRTAAIAMAITWAGVLLLYDLQAAAMVQQRLEHPDSRFPAPEAALPQNAANSKPAQGWKRLGALVGIAFPLGLVSVLVAITANVPRYFVKADLGDRGLGIFSALGYLAVVGNTFMLAVGESATPRLARYFTSGELQPFTKLTGSMMGIALVGGILGIIVALICGEPLLRFLYGPLYAANVKLFSWMMLSACIGYACSAIGYSITATRQFKRLVVPYLLVTLITIACCASFVDRHGLMGAAYGACVGNGITLVVLIALWIHGQRQSASGGREPHGD